MHTKGQILAILAIGILIVVGVASNIQQQKAVDNSKLPSKAELSKGFQRWITNLKNHDLPTEADEFRLKEKNQIYNSKWTTVASIEEPGKKEEFEKTLTEHQKQKGIVFSPSKREFLDYRNQERSGYKANEVRFYGQKEDKIIDTKILDCSLLANCYFDRAFFINNDLFVISEWSRNIDKKDTTAPACSKDETCTYTIKLHVIDLINNSRWVYESKVIDAVLTTLIPQL